MEELTLLPESVVARINTNGPVPENVPHLGPCWEWLGHINKGGYGSTTIGGDAWLVHRYTHTVLVGEIPEGLTLDHLCRNRPCCNPWHMEPVTRAMNIMRGFCPAAKNARKTHCYLGHPYDEKNSYRTARGHRRCRACNVLKSQKRKVRLKAAVASSDNLIQ